MGRAEAKALCKCIVTRVPGIARPGETPSSAFCFLLSFNARSRRLCSARKGTPSLLPVSQQSPNIAFSTVQLFVLIVPDHGRRGGGGRGRGRQPLPVSTLSFRRSVLRCSGLPLFRKFLKPSSTFCLPYCRPAVIPAVLAFFSARSHPLTPARRPPRWPGD